MKRFWQFFVAIVCTGLVMMAVVACEQSLGGILEPVKYTLSTECTPPEGGSVSPSAGPFDKGTEVNIFATANRGYEFKEWLGETSGTSNPLRIIMNSDKTIVASFSKIIRTLETQASPPGGGTVEPVRITREDGTQVTIVARPASEYEFKGWGGDASGTLNPLTITMNSHKTIVALFSKKPNIKVQISPPGGGKVTVEPAGGTYEAGTQVTIRATPDSGYRFVKWGGSASGTSNPLTIIMDGDKTVTASFIRVYKLTVSSSPSDGGTINLEPKPKDGTYNDGTKVTLSVTPLFPYYPKNWIGADNNNVFPTTMTMNDDKSVTANFAPCTKDSKPQTASGAVYNDQRGVYGPVSSIPIQLNQFDWVEGEIIVQTPNTPSTPVRAYIQGPAGNMVRDFGSSRQANFNFMAQTAGRYTVVFQNNSIWYADYHLTYTVWRKPQ